MPVGGGMYYVVKDRQTDQVVHVVECNKSGSTLEKFECGFYRKVDRDRFYVDVLEKKPGTENFPIDELQSSELDK